MAPCKSPLVSPALTKIRGCPMVSPFAGGAGGFYQNPEKYPRGIFRLRLTLVGAPPKVTALGRPNGEMRMLSNGLGVDIVVLARLEGAILVG